MPIAETNIFSVNHSRIHNKGVCYHTAAHFVVISRKTYDLKVVKLEELKQTPEGVEKLKKYSAEQRFGYVDAHQNLHMKSAQLDKLKSRNIDQVTYKPTEATVGISPLLLENATVIDDDEYAELQEEIAAFIIATQQAVVRRPFVKSYTNVCALVNAAVLAANYLEIACEKSKHKTIIALLQKWADNIRDNEARSKEDAQKQLLFDVTLKDTLIKKQILRREICLAEIERAVVMSMVEAKQYQYTCIHPVLPR